MRSIDLFARSLTFYWRTNGAVVLGVATAATVLAGALLVGDSVRGSLRDLVIQRLGRTDQVVMSPGFFRERLAGDPRAGARFAQAFWALCPMIMAQGLVTNQATSRLASAVQVYAVDDRFWQFHGMSGRGGPGSSDALVSPALASALGTTEGATVLLRMRRPSAIPLESLHGRKDDIGRAIRLTVRGVLPPGELGEFSLRPQQGDVRALFVALKRVQRELDLPGRVNTLILSAKRGAPGSPGAPGEPLDALVRRWARLE